MNNLHTIVDGPPALPVNVEPAPPRRSWLRRWWWLLAILTVVATIGGFVVWATTAYVPYVIESPGNLYTTGERITISGATEYPTTDKIDLVTVSLDTRVTHFDKFLADHNGDDVVLPAREVLGTQTADQNDELNALLMKQSKNEAVVAALTELGYVVRQTGAVVRSTEPGTPADGVVKVAETIVGVDDAPITGTQDLIAAITAHKQGDRVTLTLEAAADQARRSVDVILADHPEHPGVGFLGVSTEDRLDFSDLPTVTVDSGAIGGPSAGLAFTLGILDLMTPGDLTGGNEVAATGTISPDGTVGPIGGVESKVTTVARKHVKYFLVPDEDADAARARAPEDLQIVPVRDLDEALDFLATIGGSGLPPVSASPGS